MAAKPDQAYEYHPLAKKFPRMAPNVFKAFCADIKERGLDKPIELLDGMIFDGRHRYEACLNEGVEPRFIKIGEGTDAEKYVRAVNALRRHMTDEQIAVWLLSERAEQSKNGQGGTNCATKSNREIARETGIRRGAVDQADAIARKASEKLKAAVESGDVKPRDAAAILNKSHSVQDKALDQVESGKAKTLREAVKGGGGKQRKSRAEQFKVITDLLSRMTKEIDRLNKSIPGGKFYKEAETGLESFACAIKDWRGATR